MSFVPSCKSSVLALILQYNSRISSAVSSVIDFFLKITSGGAVRSPNVFLMGPVLDHFGGAIGIYCWLSYPVSKTLGIELIMRNSRNLIKKDTSVIYVANHQNSLDMIGIVRFWQLNSIRCSVMVKNSLFWCWPIGPAMWLAGSKFIKRDSPSHEKHRNFNKLIAELFKERDKLAVFVEGTRNPNPEKLLPFKKGAFVAAIQHQVPIQPVVFSPYYFLDWNNKRFGSGKIIIDALEPISTKGMTMKDLDNLVSTTYEAMSRKNTELRAEIKQWLKMQKKK